MPVRKLDSQPDDHGLKLSAYATAAITGNPSPGKVGGGVFVKFDTDPNYFVVCGVGDDAIGIVRTNVAIGDPGTIHAEIGDLDTITLGGTVALGADGTAYVESDANGHAVQATGLRPVLGRVTKAGVSGDVVPLIFGAQPKGPIVGADVASAATIVPTGEVFTLTGSTGVSAITATGIMTGKRITILAGAATAAITLAHIVGGTITLTADDVLELVWDGTSWHEVGRSVNA